MTRHDHPELLKSILQLLTDEGSDAFAASLGILVNEAMRAERSAVLQAQPFERTEARTGYANGFKPKTLTTRLGPITFAVPQVRGDIDFYPSALEKGVRSEQALKLALAEMYVQGVSTRKVAAVLEELCGTSVSSTHVSHCAARLDAELPTHSDAPSEAVRSDGTASQTSRQPGKFQVLGKPAHWVGFTDWIAQSRPSRKMHAWESPLSIRASPSRSGRRRV